MFGGLVIVVLLAVGYTLRIIKAFEFENFGMEDNTSHVLIGTYLHSTESIDALRSLEVSRHIGISLDPAFRGKTKYFKAFGESEDYHSLLLTQPQTIATNINNHPIMQKNRDSYIVVDWDSPKLVGEDVYEQLESVRWLQRFLVGVPRVILKIPAHYLCRTLGGAPLFQLLNHSDYLIEMHGDQNEYSTFQSVFSEMQYPSESMEYSAECPRNPSTSKLKSIFNGTANFNIERRMIPSSDWRAETESEALQASRGGFFDGILFLDDHPANLFANS